MRGVWVMCVFAYVQRLRSDADRNGPPNTGRNKCLIGESW